MNTAEIEQRIAALSAEMSALGEQLQKEVITEDFKLVDDNQCVRARMYIDDTDASRFEMYDENGLVGAQILIGTEGHSHIALGDERGSRLDINMERGNPGSIRMWVPGYDEYPSREIIIGTSDDMMVGIKMSQGGVQKIFVGIDQDGIAKISLRQEDGTVKEYGPKE